MQARSGALWRGQRFWQRNGDGPVSSAQRAGDGLLARFSATAIDWGAAMPEGRQRGRKTQEASSPAGRSKTMFPAYRGAWEVFSKGKEDFTRGLRYSCQAWGSQEGWGFFGRVWPTCKFSPL